jgi:hypothetical protein
MTLLNRPSDGLASVLMAFHRALRVFGPRPEMDLLNLVAPESAVKQDMAKKTLSRWLQLGFFVGGGESPIELAPEINEVDPEDFTAVRTALLRIIFDERNNTTLLQDDSLEEATFSGAADLCRALSWMLMQEPFHFPKNLQAVESLQGQQGVNPRPFVNDTRWSGFQEWSVLLGMAIKSGRGLTPNPALALNGFLDDIIGTSSEMPQTDFLERAALLLPVLDGGSIRVRIESSVKNSWMNFSPSDLSPSLSAALLTLEEQRRLRLELKSDAPVKNLLGKGGRQMRPFSHVKFIGGPR